MMLLAQAFVRILVLWDKGLLDLIPQNLLRERIPLVTTQLLNRTLLTQDPDGFWDSKTSLETTAFAVLTLTALESLPWVVPLGAEIASAIENGRKALICSERDWTKSQHLWIEKVAYGMPTLSEAYCLSAVRSSNHPQSWSDRVRTLVKTTEKAVSQLAKFFAMLPTFRHEPKWELNASLLEGFLHLPQLESAKMDVLPRQRHAKNEYLKFIPCTWTLVNNHCGLFLPPSLLWDMMVLTLCNFRVDEYMEKTTASLDTNQLEGIKSRIRDLFTTGEVVGRQSRKRPAEDSVKYAKGGDDDKKRSVVDPLQDGIMSGAVLNHYITTILEYPRIQKASSSDRELLHSELQAFLLSHVEQAADNCRFPQQQGSLPRVHQTFPSPRTSFYSWAHSTGADSVSCPMSFAFFTCLLGSLSPSSLDCFSSVQQKYMAHDLCSHLAVMSRLYNDYGSTARDRDEGNINSINFPEFNSNKEIHTNTEPSSVEVRLREDLLALSKYERDNANFVLEKFIVSLEANGSKDRLKTDGLQLFAKVSALYADMYVARDLSNRLDGSAQR